MCDKYEYRQWTTFCLVQNILKLESNAATRPINESTCTVIGKICFKSIWAPLYVRR